MKKWKRLLPAALVAVAAPLGVQAQEAPAGQPAWVKICSPTPVGGQNFCVTIQEIKAETGQFIASAAIREISGEESKSLVVAVPVGMMIQPGLRAQIDNNEQTELQYGVCLRNACYAELEVGTDFIDGLKRGGQLSLITVNTDGNPVTFPMTLVGFTAAYEGEGIEPEGIQQRQDDLNRALQERALEAREKLREQQLKEGATN
ncbi:invasion associated locus B family protein [Bauldia sp.]|uniref:invasion associated locus B family protein n=1 Tax=Bauldia sp. TaxID=2575872 RepID=UPI003BAA80D8